MEQNQPQLNVQVSEVLTESDKNALEMMKMKRELAVVNVKLALAQNELAETHYDNAILRLAVKYHLKDGDVIADDGTIQRKTGTQ